MTKKEFIETVADRSGLSRADAARAVDAFLDSMTEALKRGDAVSFTGFGKFATAPKAYGTTSRRSGVNPMKSHLSDKAFRLRKEAEALERSQQVFDGRLATSRKALRKIAGSV